MLHATYIMPFPSHERWVTDRSRSYLPVDCGIAWGKVALKRCGRIIDGKKGV